MAGPLKRLSPAGRRAKRERAQAEALNDLEIEARRRREKSKNLRQLRVEREDAAAARFMTWRDRQPS